MIKIPVPHFENASGISNFIGQLRHVKNVELDFSQIGYASPSGMVLLSSSIAKAVNEGRIANFVNAKDYVYPANIGFFDACGLDVKKYQSNGSSTYYPLTVHDLDQFRDNAKIQKKSLGEYIDFKVGRLAYLITRKSSGDLFYLIKFCLRKLVRNAAEHSEGKSLSICGQYWQGNGKVELAFLDDGIGLMHSLNQNPRFESLKSDLSAIRVAMLPSTSGKKIYDAAQPSAQKTDDIWENSGFGLYMTSQLARECGEFTLISGSAAQFLKQDTKADMPFNLIGTFVSIVLDVSELQRTETRIKAIADKGESFAKRHFHSGAEVIASAASRFITT